VGGRTASVRVIAAAEAAALGYGTVVHVVQLVMGGCRPYPWAPTWLAAFFASLTVLDPVAAALLWRRRTAGPYLAAFVFVTDAAANGYADSCVSPDVPATARASHAVITVMAVAVLAAVPFVRPWLRPRGGPAVRDSPVR